MIRGGIGSSEGGGRASNSYCVCIEAPKSRHPIRDERLPHQPHKVAGEPSVRLSIQNPSKSHGPNLSATAPHAAPVTSKR